MADAAFTDEDFIRFIYKSELINEILKNIMTVCDRGHSKTFTKNMELRISRGCQDWVMFYTLLYNYNKLHKNIILENQSKLGDIGPNLKELCNLYNNILEDLRNPYYKIFRSNRPNTTLQTDIRPKEALPHNGHKYQHYQMCIHNTIGIFHYFLIIRHDEQYYITSSYGSDFVAVPQFTTVLDIDEFNTYLHNTNTNNKDKSYYDFIEKYFLSNNLRKRYDEDTIDDDEKLRSLWLQPKEGIKKELGWYKQHEQQLYVSIINGYDDYIISHIHRLILPTPAAKEEGASKKSKRSKKRKKKKSKKSKRRKRRKKRN